MKQCIFILIGATGDLARRKLIPALYHSLKHKKLDNIVLLGAAREQTTMSAILDASKEHIGTVDEKIWDIIQKQCFYQQLDVTKPDQFAALHDTVKKLEKKYDIHNRLVYCATPAQFFCHITHYTTEAGILHKQPLHAEQWHRIVYEKPFGHDMASAHAINTCIANSLEEHQVFRIDHYLTKEVVSNIALIRFTNCVFEPLWNNRFIDYVEIVLDEHVGLEGRGAYYDSYGAIRDVVQNHMLQLLSLIAMEQPQKLTGEYIREQRLRVLQDTTFADGIRGQYEGYTQEDNVNPHSQTETFAALKVYINNARWRGVPFYLKTGKYLPKKETVIYIKFKAVECLLAKQCPPQANWLTIRVAPDATFSLTLNAKHPETANELIPVTMNYCHSCAFAWSATQAYELLLQEVVRGEQSVSVRFDEIESAWHLIDTIIQKNLPLYTYKKDTPGPKELETFAHKHGMRWRS